MFKIRPGGVAGADRIRVLGKSHSASAHCQVNAIILNHTMEKPLFGKVILIGKEPGQGRLLIAVDDKTVSIGSPDSVPNSVSRCIVEKRMAHASISIDAQGEMLLRNLKEQNVTFVNGTEVDSKLISPTSTIELGKDRFKIDLLTIIESAKGLVTLSNDDKKTGKPQKYSISHLQGVWDTYESELDRIALQQQEAARRRLLPIMVGSLSGVASPILATLVAVNTLYLTVPVAAVSFGLYLFNYKKRDTSYEERKVATERFTDEYVCPNPKCNKFLGNISYKLMKRQFSMQCPHCKCAFFEE